MFLLELGIVGLDCSFMSICVLSLVESRSFWCESRSFWCESRGFWCESRGFWCESRSFCCESCSFCCESCSFCCESCSFCDMFSCVSSLSSARLAKDDFAKG